MIALCWIVLAYLMGAVPSGYIIGKAFYGIDLRTRGSGNIGATNAYRELGPKAAAAVFICDFLKGVLAVWIGGSTPLLALACATAAIVGNDWSVCCVAAGLPHDQDCISCLHCSGTRGGTCYLPGPYADGICDIQRTGSGHHYW